MNSKVLILLFAVVVTGLLACKKGSADLPPYAGPSAFVNVVNAAADTINVYQNGTRINTQSDFYPGGSLGYITVTAGLQNYQVKKTGSPNVLVNMPLTLDSATTYSLFIAGTAPDKIFLIQDKVPDGNDATIRFVNSSPGATLDVTIGTGLSTKNIPFKSATNFAVASAGNNLLTIYPAGSLTPISSTTLNLTAGNAYTVFTKGIPGGTGNNAFSTRLIRNR